MQVFEDEDLRRHLAWVADFSVLRVAHTRVAVPPPDYVLTTADLAGAQHDVGGDSHSWLGALRDEELIALHAGLVHARECVAPEVNDLPQQLSRAKTLDHAVPRSPHTMGASFAGERVQHIPMHTQPCTHNHAPLDLSCNLAILRAARNKLFASVTWFVDMSVARKGEGESARDWRCDSLVQCQT